MKIILITLIVIAVSLVANVRLDSLNCNTDNNVLQCTNATVYTTDGLMWTIHNGNVYIYNKEKK